MLHLKEEETLRRSQGITGEVDRSAASLALEAIHVRGDESMAREALLGIETRSQLDIQGLGVVEEVVSEFLGLLDDGFLDVGQWKSPQRVGPTLVVVHVGPVEGVASRSLQRQEPSSRAVNPGVAIADNGRFYGQSLYFEDEGLEVGEDLDGSSMQDDLTRRGNSRDPVVKDTERERVTAESLQNHCQERLTFVCDRERGQSHWPSIPSRGTYHPSNRHPRASPLLFPWKWTRIGRNPLLAVVSPTSRDLTVSETKGYTLFPKKAASHKYSMDVNAESLNSLGQKAQQQDCI
jgi:hypothetical protein